MCPINHDPEEVLHPNPEDKVIYARLNRANVNPKAGEANRPEISHKPTHPNEFVKD